MCFLLLLDLAPWYMFVLNTLSSFSTLCGLLSATDADASDALDVFRLWLVRVVAVPFGDTLPMLPVLLSDMLICGDTFIVKATGVVDPLVTAVIGGEFATGKLALSCTFWSIKLGFDLLAWILPLLATKLSTV